jgi:NAD(P)-dependent dehydrogenase (short-subunit alcohol dehydrogenase family)
MWKPTSPTSTTAARSSRRPTKPSATACACQLRRLHDRGTILDTSPELFDQMFAVRASALLPHAGRHQDHAAQRIEGAIVNLITMSSYGGQPFITACCASKGALVTLTRNVAFAVMRERIRVNGINVGWSDTPGEDRVMKVYHGARMAG